MAKNSITDYSKTASLNTDIQSVDIDEGCLPSGINNAIREIMADLAAVNDGTVALTSPSFSSVNIDAGTIDGVTIGGTTPAAGTFTTGQFNTSLNVDGTVTADGLTVEQNTGSKITLKSTDLAIATGEIIGDIEFYSSDESGIGAASRANITVQAEDGAGRGSMYFKTATGPESSVPRALIQGNGDISFYEDTGTTAKLFWDASAERLGLGTTTPSATVDVEGELLVTGGGTGTILVNDEDSSLCPTMTFTRNGVGTSTNDFIKFETSGGEVAAINTAGGAYFSNVGIGTSSPSTKLDVKESGATDLFATFENTNGGGYGAFVDIKSTDNFSATRFTGGTKSWVVGQRGLAGGNFSIYDQDNAAHRMVIDSSGNVGIGTGSGFNQVSGTETALNIYNSNAASLYLNSGGGHNHILYSGAAGQLVFFDATEESERMRIDSSGNVGIGTSSPSAKLDLVLPSPAASASSGGIEITEGTKTFAISTTGSSYSYAGVGANELWYYGNSNFGAFTFGSDGAVPIKFISNGSERMRIDSSGNVLVGTTSPVRANQSAFVNSTAGQISFRHNSQSAGRFWHMGVESSNDVFFIYPDIAGGVYMTRGATSWTGNSDEKLKNITGEIQNGLEKVCSLRAAYFTWKSDKENKQQVGLIAQDVQKVLPEVVDTNGDGYLGVRYTDTIPLLVAAIQEQQATIKALTDRIAALQEAITKIEDLEARVATLEGN